MTTEPPAMRETAMRFVHRGRRLENDREHHENQGGTKETHLLGYQKKTMTGLNSTRDRPILCNDSISEKSPVM